MSASATSRSRPRSSASARSSAASRASATSSGARRPSHAREPQAIMGIFDRIADQLGDLIVPDDVRMHVEMGSAMLERGELDFAIRELRAAVAKRPDHARAGYLLGLACARKGDLVAAEEALAQTVAQREDFAEALVALGEVQRRQGRVEGAAESFRKALEAGLSDGALRGEAYRGLGAAWLALGRTDKAVRELRKAAAQIPEDTETQALLGRALLARGDLDAARLCLEKSTSSGATESLAAALCALGELYGRLGRWNDAESAYGRALTSLGGPERARATLADAHDDLHAIDARRFEARLGLADTRLAAGDAAGAHAHALQALTQAPESALAHLTVGRALALARSFEPALAFLDRALTFSDVAARGRVLDEALHIALRAGLAARAAGYAEFLVADADNAGLAPPPDALAAVALHRLAAGDQAAAGETIARALGRETIEVRLAQARIHLAAGQPTAAAVALRRAVETAPEDARARTLLAEVYRAAREQPPADLHGLLRSAHRVLLATPELGDLAPEAARLVEIVDRPLLVTVMGEFNSGKSTFVNALVGEEVAPMGITPTTATINVLKYGAERGGRVVYRDGGTREVPWNDVPSLLKGLDEAEARRIRVVEVLYPLEALQRVNVVDTPGLNSILPEHEETAREFIAQADAIVWLFSIGQAGKASEREALLRIRDEHKKTLGVVNKIDRTDEEGLKEILAHLATSFGDLVEAIVPFSARDALLGQKEKDKKRLAKSNREELGRVLEERFFARSHSIKREAAARRLGALLDQALARGEQALASTAQSEIDAALSSVRADQVVFARRFVAEERLRLVADLDALYTAASREILDFVRPRRWAFGSNQAAPADRDFLLALVDDQLAGLAARSRVRVLAEAERTLAAQSAVAGVAAGSNLERLRILDEQVYGRFGAFARGYLRGGRVDDFFTRVLPKLELSEASIRRALERDMPDVTVADAELLLPLKAWGERFFGGLLARLRRLADAEELRRFEVEERLLGPVAALRAALIPHAAPATG
ncbi:MAG: tetratricopeptide repeat protein [Myxococcales bacterium]|nr:tetratricopeptide repeat protein [Myxococcales bacterium]